jgi:hypothetical protein
MLVSRAPIRREVPHEEGAWFEFCKLSWKQLAKARRSGLVENADKAKLFGVEWVKALTSDDEERAKKLSEAQEWDPSNFGTEDLLELGIVGWSYEEEVTVESIGNLDGATGAWAKQEIINLNKPPSEDEVKKISGDSS